MTKMENIISVLAGEWSEEPFTYDTWSEFLEFNGMTSRDFKKECISICESEAVSNCNWDVLLDEQDGTFEDENGKIVEWKELLKELKKYILKKK